MSYNYTVDEKEVRVLDGEILVATIFPVKDKGDVFIVEFEPKWTIVPSSLIFYIDSLYREAALGDEDLERIMIFRGIKA